MACRDGGDSTSAAGADLPWVIGTASDDQLTARAVALWQIADMLRQLARAKLWWSVQDRITGDAPAPAGAQPAIDSLQH